jgi:general secretion pathway protein K
MSNFEFKGDDERGFVLVAVIWMAGLLAVVATAFVLTARSHTMIARNTVTKIRAEYIADGMVKLTALQLVKDMKSGSFKLNGVPHFCQWTTDTVVGLSIQDQGGLIDLNVASPDLLKTLFKGLNVPEADAQKLINNLQDFRDPDSVAVGSGEEPIHFPNKNFGPKNAPFSMVEEIDQVQGANEELLARLMPLLTVYSQQTGFDPTRAPQQLLDALGANNAKIDQFTSPSPATGFEIDVIVKTRQSAVFYRKAIIDFILQPDRPFAVLEWKQGRSATEWNFPAQVEQSCLL